jgi:hypothetical protein
MDVVAHETRTSNIPTSRVSTFDQLANFQPIEIILVIKSDFNDQK